MRFAYKDLVRKAGFIYGPGPAGFFIKRFRKSGFSEAELIVNEWTDQTPVFFCGLPLVLVKSFAYLILLLVYVCARFRFEQGKSALLCALEHIDAIEKAKQGGEAK